MIFLHKRNMLFGTPEYIIEKIKELKISIKFTKFTSLV